MREKTVPAVGKSVLTKMVMSSPLSEITALVGGGAGGTGGAFGVVLVVVVVVEVGDGAEALGAGACDANGSLVAKWENSRSCPASTVGWTDETSAPGDTAAITGVAGATVDVVSVVVV